MKRLFYISYLLCLIYLVWLLPSDTKLHATFNLIPLKTIRLYFTAFLHDYAPIYVVTSNLIGNIVLFIPIGILLFNHFRHMGILSILFFSIYIPVYIEVGQYLLHLAGYGTRSIDIDDVLLNFIGIWIGYSATFLLYKKMH
ncbi:VanZ family protein [Pseudogracilibacillus sp. SE30717A]|uniref:VanZ family protein n=1 Tax=Pseudogracilibacillus sp. SE30717A TaxID=3098293 RepID=UPI00300E370D